MKTPLSPTHRQARVGGWLPSNHAAVDRWIHRLKARVAADPQPLITPIAELRDMVYDDPALHGMVAAMFAEAYALRKTTPLGEPAVRNFEEFLALLNAIMTIAPEAYQEVDRSGAAPELEPAGFIGFPINALLQWPMSTAPGYDVFSNALINQQLKKVLAYWSTFLTSADSRYVLGPGGVGRHPLSIPWLSPPAKKEMVAVATSAVGAGEPAGGDTFESIFQCQPDAPYYGFASWDDFFTRLFCDGVRPVAAPDDDDVIVNACESAPFRLAPKVALSDQFWLKGQPYSLENMLDFDPWAAKFEQGTVYQAFLSALSYHRWHSPVSGVVVKTRLINGSYYLPNRHEGFASDAPDPVAPNDSQPFLSAVATRAVMYIKADNDAIGLMCVIAIGMAEVSSCEMTVRPGDRVSKGQQIGMFHFGGSTHCLVFRPGVELDFDLYGLTPGPTNETNIRINTALARVKRS